MKLRKLSKSFKVGNLPNGFWVHHCPKKPAVTNDSVAMTDDAVNINSLFSPLDIFCGDQHFQVFTKAGGKAGRKIISFSI
jgi:hypothetical protein